MCESVFVVFVGGAVVAAAILLVSMVRNRLWAAFAAFCILLFVYPISFWIAVGQSMASGSLTAQSQIVGPDGRAYCVLIYEGELRHEYLAVVSHEGRLSKTYDILIRTGDGYAPHKVIEAGLHHPSPQVREAAAAMLDAARTGK